jgi:hypothetical protein
MLEAQRTQEKSEREKLKVLTKGEDRLDRLVEDRKGEFAGDASDSSRCGSTIGR